MAKYPTFLDEIECLKCGEWINQPGPGRSTVCCDRCGCCHGLDAFRAQEPDELDLGKRQNREEEVAHG